MLQVLAVDPGSDNKDRYGKVVMSGCAHGSMRGQRFENNTKLNPRMWLRKDVADIKMVL